MSRPDAHQPLKSGPPTAYPSEDQDILYRVPPRPERATKDTRANTVGGLLAGFTHTSGSESLPAGHDQDLFDPEYNAGNLQQGMEIVRRQPYHENNRMMRQADHLVHGPSIMLNGPNACFAAAGFLFLVAIEVTILRICLCFDYLVQIDQHLDVAATQNTANRNLQSCMQQMAADYRNHSIPPFGPARLLHAYNLCVQPNLQFPIGQMACAIEFTIGGGGGGLIRSLYVEPNYLVTYMQEGNCTVCHRQNRQVGYLNDYVYFNSLFRCTLTTLYTYRFLTTLRDKPQLIFDL